MKRKRLGENPNEQEHSGKFPFPVWDIHYSVKRKLSPEKVADTENNEVKSARSEDKNDV